ncbi:cupin domain-containing protein [Nocardioides sp.]|uniref:cupin domain-containing protein n=1 Tax=Nocardioides sp. TaxID=35761 RepID=UPI003D0C4FD3
MIHIPPCQQPGPISKTGSQFTGQAFPYLTLPATDGVTINTVSFTPGARTYWHSHDQGQILQVVAGRGCVQSEGGDCHELRVGDTVWTPPGERHWHGAAPDSYLTHVAISLGTTHWAEELDELGYQAAVDALRDAGVLDA